MHILLKNVFCTLYSDSSGFTWLFWMLLFSFFLFPCFVWNLIIAIKKYKNGNKRFIKLNIPFYLICLFCFYQLIPSILQNISLVTRNENLMKKSINLAIFPYQKGAYYCALSDIYLINKKYSTIENCYHNAYKYLKSYDFPCWGFAFLYYKNKGDYDTAIAAAMGLYDSNKNNKQLNQNMINGVLSTLYVMKQNYNKALYYANIDVKNKDGVSKDSYMAIVLAKRGFIYNKLAQKDLAQKDLEKALSLCKNKDEIKKVNDTYYNYRSIELKRELRYKQKVGNK